MLDIAQIDPHKLDQLGVDQLRELVDQLLEGPGRDAHEIGWRDAKIDKLTFEISQLKRLQYSAKSEQLSADQRALFDEAVDDDIAAIEEQLAALQAILPPKTDSDKLVPKRGASPVGLPRVDRHHEPENPTCSCGCQMSRIGEDVSEKLDYAPGSFTPSALTVSNRCVAALRAEGATTLRRSWPPRLLESTVTCHERLQHVRDQRHCVYRFAPRL